MKLFTKDIDNKLFKQYPLGNQLEKQKVVAKIFNPYGQGRWYLLNSDPEDPDYLWAIVQMGRNVEIGSVSRRELETIRVSPFRFPLERDLGFSPVNAYELWKGLGEGKFYKDGGWVNNENKEMLENQSVEIEHHAEELEDVLPKVKDVEPWVVAKAERAATDLSDLTHYLDGESRRPEMKEEVEEMSDEIDDFDRGGYMANGGAMSVGRFYKDKQGDFFRYIGEGRFLNKSGEYVKKSIEDFYEEGGELKEEFLEDMEELHGSIKSVTLKDDSVVTHEELMKAHKMDKGGDIKKQEWVAVYVNQEKPNERKIIQAFGDTKEEATKNARMSEGFYGIKKPLELTEIYTYSGNLPMLAEGGMMEKGGGTSSPNTKFMKWFVDWSKSVNKYVDVAISIPNEFSSPKKDDKGEIVILDVIEKKGDTDAKKYLNEILKKADEFGVSIYLQPIPRTHNLKSEEHKKKITKDYLIKYYEKFGFENTDGGFMVRAPKMDEGGETDDDGVDLFEDYDNIPQNVQKVLDKYSESFEDGDYKGLQKANKELAKIGYTFEYDLDGQAYDLRKIGQKGKMEGEEMAGGGEISSFEKKIKDAMKEENKWHFFNEEIDGKSVQLKMFVGKKEVDVQIFRINGLAARMPRNYVGKRETTKMILDNFQDKMMGGGDVKFKDKVKSVKESLLKRKKVAKKVQKDYGKTYSPKEAEESAKRIVGAMTAKEKLKMRMAKKKKK